jgi:hypothetical protein
MAWKSGLLVFLNSLLRLNMQTPYRSLAPSPVPPQIAGNRAAITPNKFVTSAGHSNTTITSQDST